MRPPLGLVQSKGELTSWLPACAQSVPAGSCDLGHCLAGSLDCGFAGVDGSSRATGGTVIHLRRRAPGTVHGLGTIGLGIHAVATAGACSPGAFVDLGKLQLRGPCLGLAEPAATSACEGGVPLQWDSVFIQVWLQELLIYVARLRWHVRGALHSRGMS